MDLKYLIFLQGMYVLGLSYITADQLEEHNASNATVKGWISR